MNEELPGAGAVARQMAEMLDAASHAPWRFGFFALLRRLAAARPDQPSIGLAARPRQEAFAWGRLRPWPRAARNRRDRDAVAIRRAPRWQRPVAAADPAVRAGHARIERTAAIAFHRDRARPHGERGRQHPRGLSRSVPSPLPHAHLPGLGAEPVDRGAGSPRGRAFQPLYRAPDRSRSGRDPRFGAAVARTAGRGPHLGRETRHPDGLAGTLAHFFAIPVRLREFMPY